MHDLKRSTQDNRTCNKSRQHASKQEGSATDDQPLQSRASVFSLFYIKDIVHVSQPHSDCTSFVVGEMRELVLGRAHALTGRLSLSLASDE